MGTTFILFTILYRICIHTKDIEWLTGKGERYARYVMRDIRLLHKKQKHQVVTIREACAYLGLPYEEVFELLNKRAGK